MNGKTRYGWMALGSMLCLFGVVLACKIRDGNRAVAQTDLPTPKMEVPEPPRVEAGKKDEKLVPLSERARTLPPIVSGAPLPDVKPESKVAVPAPPCPPGDTAAPTGPEPILIPASASVPVPPLAAAPPPPIAPPPLPKSDPMPPMAPVVPPTAPAVVPPSSDPLLATPPTLVPTQLYRVRSSTETLKSIARECLGSAERWGDVQKLNPTLKADKLAVGTVVQLPMDAIIPDEVGAIKPLPALRTKLSLAKPKVLMPLMGTYQVTLDDHKSFTLPKAIRAQLSNCDTVMVSPGTDKCLWLTNQAHLDRMGARLDKSHAREVDVRNFKRLYYAQAVKATISADGKVTIAERLAAFGGLTRDMVVVGIDDHFELWDAAGWRRYTQQKARAAVTPRD